MKIFATSNNEHAAELTKKLAANNTQAAVAPSPELDVLEYEAKDLAVSFNESEFDVAAADAEKRKNCALADFKELLAPGEELKNYRFGATTKKVGNLQAGCPVLEAETNMAKYTVVYDDFVVKDGTITNNTASYGNYKPKKSLKSGIFLKLAKEFAKAIGKSVGTELFGVFFPSDKDQDLKDELGKMKVEIKDMLDKVKYDSLEDRLVGSRGWLRDTYSLKLKAYNEKQTVDMEEVRGDLKKRQEDLQAISEALEQRITTGNLNTCDYATRVQVVLYASSAAMRITLFKEQIFWQNILRAPGNKYDNDADINELKSYVAKVIRLLKSYISTLKSAREGKISTVETKNYRTTHYNKLDTSFTDWTSVSWSDTFESSKTDDPFKGEKIYSTRKVKVDSKDKNVDQMKADAEKERADHIAAVRGLFGQYIEDPLNEVVGKLESIPYVISK